ncbi:MAG: hypothetical protein MI920_34480 [Kiloniellales bacterium]|nr:hypothetical protein [Kiloniellales bacterium]
MPDYDVRLKLDDDQHSLHLEVYQRVCCEGEESEDTVVQRAKAQFWNWAMKRGSEWSKVAMRIPFLTVTEAEVQEAGALSQPREEAKLSSPLV